MTMKNLDLKAPILFIMLMLFYSLVVTAQPNIDDATTELQNAGNTLVSWVHIAIGVGLCIAAGFMIYKVANGEPQSKPAVVGWIIGVILWVVAFRIVNY